MNAKNVYKHYDQKKMELFIGKNADYYQKKWKGKSGWFCSWNWAACFGNIGWLIYRKMYTHAVIFHVLMVALTELRSLIIQYYPRLEKASDILIYIVPLMLGLFGNALYLKKYQQTISLDLNDDQIQQTGGIDSHTMIIYVVITAIHSLAAIVITVLNNL